MSRSIPLINIWSEYSLLRSTFRIESGLARLRELGFLDVGLADWETLAGAEIFDRVAREQGLTPWIGVCVLVDFGAVHRPLFLYAADRKGWGHLSTLMQRVRPIPVHLAASPHVIAVWPADVEPSLPTKAPTALWEAGFLAVAQMLWPPDPKTTSPLPGGPWVPACPVRYAFEREREAYEVLGRIGNHRPGGTPHTLLSLDALRSLYPDTWWDQCLSVRPEPSVLPPIGLKLPTVAQSSAEEVNQLRDKVAKGLAMRYPEMTLEVIQRRDHELSVIEAMGFAGYFLMVEDVVRHAKTEGIRVGPGRGSAAGSLVSYALGITAIDPLAHGLIFERFLNPARRTMPDIDLDFDFERRTDVIEYLRGRWGSDRVAQIGTYGTFGGRAVVRDVGKVLELPQTVVDRVAKGVSFGAGTSAVAALMDQADPSGRWNRLAQAIEGLVRHSSTHAAGVIIAPFEVEAWLPCNRDPEGRLVTQMEMASLERLGFLKLDILGLRTLTVVRQVEAALGVTDEFFYTLDPEDRLTLESLGKGDTEAVFQLDGSGVVELLKNMKPRSLSEVMAVVALYRPGPMENIRLFLDRRRGQQPIPRDPVSQLLPDTYGILVYQEQLMMVIRELAGYSWADADTFRRAISKKDRDLLDRERERFIEALSGRGMAEAARDTLWHQIMAFADYGFNKSHAAAYGSLSYYMAFLKAHHPLEFWAAELSSLSDTGRLQHTLDTLVSRGIALLMPDVNRSSVGFARDGLAVRVGLNAIRGLTRGLAERVVTTRQNGGDYRDVADFMGRIGPISDRDMELLEAAGILGALPGDPFRPTQISWFEEGGVSTPRSGRADSEQSFGWRWPEAVGPLYVRLETASQEQEVAAAIRTVAKAHPGELSIVLVRDRNRGYSLPGSGLDSSPLVIDLVRQLRGVLACGRRVQHLPAGPGRN